MLLPNLSANAVIVLDNASYHNIQDNKPPTANSKKVEIQNWLDSHKIQYAADDTKIELLQVVKIHKPRFKTFSIDRILARHGHAAIRLPPYHPELNPIEKIWGIVKNWVAQKNVTFRLDDVRRLAEEKFSSVTKEEWVSVCDHVKNIEKKLSKVNMCWIVLWIIFP